MLKILINNEEVVSNKNFSIVQEMLNTPSVILNNVYPKAWEVDKDYVSRFYHPQDYSKCKIQDETYIPFEPGTTVTSSNGFISLTDVNTNKLFEYELQGDTKQTTTTGKNLINDKLRATATNNVYIGAASASTTFPLNAGTYTISTNVNCLIQVLDSSSVIFTPSSNVTSFTFTLTANTNIRVRLQKQGLTSADVQWVQLESGSSATTYEPYSNGVASPSPDAPQEVQVVSGRQTILINNNNYLPKPESYTTTNNGITFTSSGDGSYRISGSLTTATSTSYNFRIQDTLLKAGTYYIHLRNSGTTTGNIAFAFLQPNGTSQITYTTPNQTNRIVSFTLAEDTMLGYTRLFVNSNMSGTFDITLKPSIETTNTVTDFVDYNGNTYEINLGKNLFDKSNLNALSNYYVDSTGKIVYGAYNKLCWVKLEPNATYTLQQPKKSNVTTRIALYSTTPVANATGTLLATVSGTNPILQSFTTTSTNYFLAWVYCNTNTLGSYTEQDMLDCIQIERGSIATSYAEYKTPIELCKIGNYQDFIRKGTGKNLFDKDSGFRLGYINANGSFTSSNTTACFNQYIGVEPNTTYTISFSTNVASLGCPVYYDTSKTLLSRENAIANVSKRTITTPNDCYFMVIQFNYNNSSTMTQEIINSVNCMVEKGNQATEYEPYGFDGKWYLYKAIEKVVLNGSENIGYATGTGYYRYIFTNNDFLNKSNLGNSILIASNYFKGTTFNSRNTDYNETIYQTSNGNSTGHGFGINTNVETTLTNFKTWLSNNKPVVYYILATPTATEITDTTLLSQLNAIELLEGINNISNSTPYLPAIMKLHYNYVNEETIVDLLFCGVVKNSGNISLNPREPHYSTLQILDYKTFLSEGETLDFVIANKTILQAIQQVIDAIAEYGFELGNVSILSPNDVIGAYSTKDKTAYDVFNYIADITQSRWTTRLLGEGRVAIDFYDPTLMPQGTAINYTTQWFADNLIDDISYSYGSQDYRNRQVMTSNEVFGDIAQIQTIVANGYDTSFMTDQQIGLIQTIYVNGVEKTATTNDEKNLGFTADFYYTIGSNIFESAGKIATGAIINLTYTPIVKGRQAITNNTEINRVSTSTGVKGVIARYENRNDAITSNELRLIGESYLKYKGSSEIKLNVVSRKNLWNIGQRVSFTSPIDELTTEYMVKKKIINRVLANPNTEDIIFYTFELSSSFNSEQAINYFDNQRAKANGNIGEGEYISRNIDIENEATIIFYDTQSTQITLTGDNQLQCSLSSPLIS